jgi:hypothetical protein
MFSQVILFTIAGGTMPDKRDAVGLGRARAERTASKQEKGLDGTATATPREARVEENVDVFIHFDATTYRIGRTQTADVIVSVRQREDPDTKIGCEVMTGQIVQPVSGERANGRRVVQVTCTASWDIASDSDEAMQDFTVNGTASSQGIGNMDSTVTFVYDEMERRTTATTGSR